MMLKASLVILGATLAAFCQAGVMPSQSRVVYEAADNDKSLMLANTNAYPVIVQNWIDNGEGTPDSPAAPFTSVPPVFRLDAGGVKGVRIIYNRSSLPQDRESLFWFNIYEIPPEKRGSAPDNAVLVTMNTQIKLFYRPSAIVIKPQQAIEGVTCRKKSKTTLLCNNPSPLHLSLIDLQLTDSRGEKDKTLSQDLMLQPFTSKTYQFNNIADRFNRVSLTYIDDAGNQQQHLTEVTMF